ncbi:hypothetical protein ACIBHX_01850 [Nonomuraea sp. NPDC050536]|uniref:hypothetical protein n=1 Tax=Nonomuraea sp. NPDC050536 TaxID=3364366 RepID=UPI0037C6CFBF
MIWLVVGGVALLSFMVVAFVLVEKWGRESVRNWNAATESWEAAAAHWKVAEENWRKAEESWRRTAETHERLAWRRRRG